MKALACHLLLLGLAAAHTSGASHPDGHTATEPGLATNSWTHTRKLSQSSVDPAQSIVYSGNLTGPIFAGSWTYFSVQLVLNGGTNDTNQFDGNLAVTCNTDASAPPNSSFCFVQPFIQPQGNGLYVVQFMVGTVWGARAQFPPPYSTPLQNAFFQGNNSISVTYSGNNLPGSPFQMNQLQGEPIVSLQRSFAALPIPSLFVSQTNSQLVTIANLYNIMDRFGNWIRYPSLQTMFVATLTPVSGGGQTVTLPLTWFRINWGLLVNTQLFQAGDFTLRMFYTDSNNETAPVRIQLPDRAFTFNARFTVRPGRVANYLSTGLPSITAGVLTNAVNYTVRDQWSNPTFLIDPSVWNVLMTYSIAMQSVSWLQVMAVGVSNNQSVNGTLMIDSTTMGAAQGFVNVTLAGQYTLRLLQNTSVVSAQSLTVAPGPVSSPPSSFSLPTISLFAGTPFTVSVTLLDVYNNPVPNQGRTLSVMITAASDSTTSYPAFTVTAPSPGAYSLNSLMIYQAGSYAIQATSNGMSLGPAVTVTVAANPVVSARFSLVTGFGAGAAYDGNGNLSPGDQPTALVAGTPYRVIAQAYDDWGNRQCCSMPNFTLASAPRGALATLNTSQTGDGRTVFTYTITTAGSYNITVLTPINGTVQVGAVVVNSALPCANCSFVQYPPTVTAGSPLIYTVRLMDLYNNPVTTDMSPALTLRLFPLFAPPTDNQQTGTRKLVQTQAPAMSNYTAVMTSPGVFSFTVNLTTAGRYQAEALYWQQSITNTSGGGAITIAPSQTVAPNTIITGPAAAYTNTPTVLSVVARDAYNNTVPGVRLAGSITSVSVLPRSTPPGSWSCQILDTQSANVAAVLVFTSLQATTLTVTISLSGIVLQNTLTITFTPAPPPSSPILPLPLPPNSTQQPSPLPFPAPTPSPTPPSSSNSLSTTWTIVIAIAAIAVAAVLIGVLIVACKGRGDMDGWMAYKWAKERMWRRPSAAWMPWSAGQGGRDKREMYDVGGGGMGRDSEMLRGHGGKRQAMSDQGAMTSPTGGRLSHLLTPHDMLKDNPYTHTDTTTKHMYMDDKDTHMQIPAYQYDNAATQYRSSGGGARMYDDTAVMAHIATPRSGSPRQLQPQPQLERQQRQLSAPEAAAAAAAAVTGVAARVSQRWWTPAGQQHDNNGVGVMHGGGSPYQPSSERLSQRLSYPVTSPSQRSPSTGPEPLLRPSLSSPTQHAPRLSLSRTAPSPSYTTSNTQQPPQQTQIYSNPLAFAPPDSARSPRQSQQASPRRGSQGSGGGGVPVRVSRQGSPSYMSPMVGRPSAVDLVVNGGQQRASSLGYGSPGM